MLDSYATLIVFANFLLDKASQSDNDSDDDTPVGAKDPYVSRPKARASFPSFEEYLRERSEIKKILSRRTLD